MREHIQGFEPGRLDHRRALRQLETLRAMRDAGELPTELPPDMIERITADWPTWVKATGSQPGPDAEGLK